MRQFRVISMDKENQNLRIPPKDLLREELQRVESKRDFRRAVMYVAGALAVAAALTALAATRLFVMIRVNGESMAPTFEDREVVIIRQTKAVERGDIIGFYYGGRILLKRYVGDAGDYIDIDDEGNVYVNGAVIDEPYLDEKAVGNCDIEFPYKVPEGMIFVLGDNRAVSLDSRTKSIGCVDRDQLAGRVVYRAWPLGRIGFMH